MGLLDRMSKIFGGTGKGATLLRPATASGKTPDQFANWSKICHADSSPNGTSQSLSFQ